MIAGCGDEPAPRLNQSPCQQSGLADRILAVSLLSFIRLLRQIGELWHAGLHAERHLVLLNARLDFRIAVLLVLLAVQLVEPVEHLSP